MKALLIGRCIAIFAACFQSGLAFADQFIGQVIVVLDGDTVTLQSEGAEYRIRLAGIDAPEKAQAFGARATQNLRELVLRRTVTVDYNPKQPLTYGRTIGKLLLDGVDINLLMVAKGLAWHYVEFQRTQSAADRALYEQAQLAAKNQQLGLWADTNPTPPWVYRHSGTTNTGGETNCACNTGVVCTGLKGGKFCLASDGHKVYSKKY